MSLKDRIRRDESSTVNYHKALFREFGVLENPFPAAGQPLGHPRLESDIDDKIVADIQEFELSHDSQVIVIEGTQGVGKTNLLNHYQSELEDLYRDDKTFYIIRYYPDPEPGFDSIIRKVFQELGENHFRMMGQKLSLMGREESANIIDMARNHEVRLVLHSLATAAKRDNGYLDTVVGCAMEWFLGLRILNAHKYSLGVRFRLDTVESRTQALRDIVVVSVNLGVLRGIFLMLDELEKQEYSLSTTPIVRYLSAIRALIDALPTHLFLMLALTPVALRRYFTMLPAIAGRLQKRYELLPLTTEEQALALYGKYLEVARKKAELNGNIRTGGAKGRDILGEQEIRNLFEELSEKSGQKGISGVTQRDFLNQLHLLTQERFRQVQ
jgi:hypothetical protein